MADATTERKGHSAEQFVESRDYWWHGDFLRACVGRWRLGDAVEVLDVGCGVGHWGRCLLGVLPSTARLIGVDAESQWVERARSAAGPELTGRVEYRPGNAYSLPFADSRFDLVTCQTVLMHLSEPARAIAEMVRVVRRGGIVAVAEPTNVCGPVVDSIAMGDAPAVTAELLNLLLTCQLGATHLGLGSQLIGESMPALFRAAGLLDVEVRQCDRTWTLVPPYESEFEKAQVQDARDALTARRWVWDEKTAKTYFIAGGGDEAAFDAKWTLAMSQLERVVEAIEAGRFSRAGGGLSYLVAGRRR